MKLSGLLPPEAALAVRLPRVGFGPPMSGTEWHCFRIRPTNHPRRRIAGAARLLSRFLEPGLVVGLGGIADTGTPQDLTAALTVTKSPVAGPACIGAARARDLAVNVVLPLLHGLAGLQGEPAKAETCLQLYWRFGKLQHNELTREMADQLLLPGWRGVPNTSRRQQWLIHLQRLLTGAS